ncbi:MAG: hypothetical protein K1X33_08290 [Methanobacteriaceae archaeon]|nr:hypothetical protein [Methanobacteriaceae archaeon]
MKKLDKLQIDQEGQEYIANLPPEFIEQLAHLNEAIPNPIDEILSENTERYEDKRLNYLLFENPKILQFEQNYKNQLLTMAEKVAENKEITDSLAFINRFPQLKKAFHLE